MLYYIYNRVMPFRHSARVEAYRIRRGQERLIEEAAAAIAKKEALIAEAEAAIAEKDKVLAEKDNELQAQAAEIARLKALLANN